MWASKVAMRSLSTRFSSIKFILHLQNLNATLILPDDN
jgi:hypothetical protein